MDFMQLLRSFEALLFELVTWLVFYPVTLWRAVTRPLATMAYADRELGDAESEQYTDTLSPPLFLFLTLLIAHFIEPPLNPALVARFPMILGQETNLLIFRAVMFAVFPLILSLIQLRARRHALNRKSLRVPFYAQCFVAAPFALGIDSAFWLLHGAGSTRHAAGLAISVVTLGWYIAVQTAWLRKQAGFGILRAVLATLATLIVGAAAILAVAIALVLS